MSLLGFAIGHMQTRSPLPRRRQESAEDKDAEDGMLDALRENVLQIKNNKSTRIKVRNKVIAGEATRDDTTLARFRTVAKKYENAGKREKQGKDAQGRHSVA